MYKLSRTSAVEWMQKVLVKVGESPQRDVGAYITLAMGQYQLEHIDEARAALR